MTHFIRRYVPIAILCALIAAGSPTEITAQPVTQDQLKAWVGGIAGKDPEGRREFVREQLRSLDVPFDELPFDTTFTRRGNRVSLSGTNIVASFGDRGPVVVVGAHYDAVPGSPGANDNGAGVAVLLGIASSLRTRQLPLSIRLCFFDQEERGLIGSAVYVREHAAGSDHLAMINLDIVGFGSEIFVGPVGEGDDDVIIPKVRAAAKELGLELQEADVYPSSDHNSFAREGLENISVSVVPVGDTRRVTSMLRGEEMTDTNRPIVLRTMHTPRDGMDTIEPPSMMMAFRLVRGVLTRLGNMR